MTLRALYAAPLSFHVTIHQLRLPLSPHLVLIAVVVIWTLASLWYWWRDDTEYVSIRPSVGGSPGSPVLL